MELKVIQTAIRHLVNDSNPDVRHFVSFLPPILGHDTSQEDKVCAGCAIDCPRPPPPPPIRALPLTLVNWCLFGVFYGDDSDDDDDDGDDDDALSVIIFDVISLNSRPWLPETGF